MKERLGIILLLAAILSGCRESSLPPEDDSGSSQPPAPVYDWPLFRGNAEMQGISREDMAPPLTQSWSFEIPVEEGKKRPPIKASPVIAGGKVFFGGNDATFYAVDLETGDLIWKRKVEGPITAPAAYRDGRCFVGDTYGFVYAIDAENGEEIWRFEADDKIEGGVNLQEISSADGAEADELQVYFGSHDFFLYCLVAETGELKWKHETENYIMATPSIDEQTKATIFGGCDGFLHVISTVDGESLQKVDVGQYIPNSAAVRDGIAYLAHHGGEVMAIDLASGEIAWRVTTGDEYQASPAVTETAVIAAGTDKVVEAFDRVTGEKMWTFQSARSIESSPVVCESAIWFGGMDGRLYAISPKDGSELWSWDLGARISASLAISAGKLLVCGEDGIVYAFEKATKMKGTPKIGTIGEERFVVGEEHLIDFAHDGMPEILCTPSLVWFLEHAARNALLPLLDPGESCVGVVVNVKHIAPTPPGEEVVCRARVINTDKRLISFQVEAYDQHEKIAVGTHKRRVVRAASIAKKVEGKRRVMSGKVAR